MIPINNHKKIINDNFYNHSSLRGSSWPDLLRHEGLIKTIIFSKVLIKEILSI